MKNARLQPNPEIQKMAKTMPNHTQITNIKNNNDQAMPGTALYQIIHQPTRKSITKNSIEYKSNSVTNNNNYKCNKKMIITK
jgi:hypothetical protein